MSERQQILKFQKINPDAIIPNYAHVGDAGFDLYTIVEGVVNPGKIVKFPLGIQADIPENWCVIFKDKSGLGEKGIHVVGGVIDSCYTGEWIVMLTNDGDQGHSFKVGAKVAQGILFYCPQAKIIEVSKINKKTSRDKNGFGSTGK